MDLLGKFCRKKIGKREMLIFQGIARETCLTFHFISSCRTIDRRKRLLIIMDAAFGMEYLHGKNIIHFDLKCENMLVNMKDPQRPICKVLHSHALTFLLVNVTLAHS